MMRITDIKWNADAVDPNPPRLSDDPDLGILSKDEMEEWRLCVHIIRGHAYMHRFVPGQARKGLLPTALFMCAAWWEGPNWFAYVATALAGILWLHMANIGYALWLDRHNKELWTELEKFCLAQTDVINLIGRNTGQDRQTFAFVRRTLRLFREINLSPVDVDAGP